MTAYSGLMKNLPKIALFTILCNLSMIIQPLVVYQVLNAAVKNTKPNQDIAQILTLNQQLPPRLEANILT